MSRDMTLVHPRLQEKVELLKKRFPKIGFSDGMRTKAEQDALYEQGRTKAGKIVTNVKYPNSQHNWGIAVDFFHNQVGNLYPLPFMNEVAAYAKSIGLGWGGDWTGFIDRPHLYLPDWGSTTSKLTSQYKTPAEFQKTWGKAPTSTPIPTHSKPTSPTTSTSGYTGDSIVAYLNSIGVDGSQANRRKLAVQYGVANYDLSAKKNLELLAKIRNSNNVSSTPKPTAQSVSTPSGYVVGRAYTTQVSALNVRTGAGANFAKKSKSQLSADGRKNSNASGQLNKGVKVTCQQVAKDSAGNTWISIPSGWICAVWRGAYYVE